MPNKTKPEIETLIYVIRVQNVMLDYDLAELYGVETKVLNQAVGRNLARFPADFMFKLTDIEREKLSRSQIVTGSRPGANLRYPPNVFTEKGIAMLSGVLRSEEAIQVHISIIRVFFRLREILRTNREFSEKLENIEKN